MCVCVVVFHAHTILELLAAVTAVLSNRLLFSYLGDVPAARVVSSWSQSLVVARRTRRPNEIIVRGRERDSRAIGDDDVDRSGTYSCVVYLKLCCLFVLASLLLGGFGAAAATEPTVVVVA